MHCVVCKCAANNSNTTSVHCVVCKCAGNNGNTTSVHCVVCRVQPTMATLLACIALCVSVQPTMATLLACIALCVSVQPTMKEVEEVFKCLGDPPSISSHLILSSFSPPLFNYNIRTYVDHNQLPSCTI